MLVLLFFVSMLNGLSKAEVTIVSSGLQPDNVAHINDDSIETCTTFEAGKLQYSQLFKDTQCSADAMTVTLVARDVTCGQDLYVVGLTAADVNKPLNQWKKCKQIEQLTGEWCNFQCDCSGGCKQVMLLQWPRTMTNTSWTLCDLSTYCDGVWFQGCIWRYNSSCYQFSSQTYSYADALNYCRTIGGALISIETVDEFDHIFPIMKEIQIAWTSGKRISGGFKWESGSELPGDSPMWNGVTPNYNKDCVALARYDSYAVEAYLCTYYFNALCEFHL